jgi:hypothetical protein
MKAQGGLMLGTVLTFILLVSGSTSAQAPEHVQLYDRGIAEYQRANYPRAEMLLLEAVAAAKNVNDD